MTIWRFICNCGNIWQSKYPSDNKCPECGHAAARKEKD